MHSLQNIPLIKDLVLIGGGHAHALVLRMWGMQPMAGVRLTVINPGPAAPYTGMLPGLIAGHYRRDEIFIDLVRLARFAGARVILDRATGIDRDQRMVMLQSGRRLGYDIASVDIGIGSGLPTVPGFAEHAVAAKPLGHYADRWEDFVARAGTEPMVTVIGGGVGGVELALASAHRLRATGRRPRVTVLEQGPAALRDLGPGTRRRLLDRAAGYDIQILPDTTAARIEDGVIHLSDGRVLPSDFTLSVAGGQPQGWLADTGLGLTDGFLTVGPTLQTSDPAILAAGDTAHLSHAPRPKAGVYAVREAPILFYNLRALLAETGKLRSYAPQKDYLKLISMGDRLAVADKFGLRAGGAWLWHWKDRIDRKFMAMFADYPAMPAAALPKPQAAGLEQALGAKPLCGGCGAKVGAEDLSAALAHLPPTRHADVISGPGDDAAILTRPDGGFEVMTTDHLRSFWEDPGLFARLAAIHALGDIWAMGAAPHGALVQITLPRLSPALQRATLAEITSALSDVLGDAGADILGGHSSIGSELTIGLTLTGRAARITGKGGARPGDALILTKPIGTGTLLAAEMARARLPDTILGEDVAACLAAMKHPQTRASAILAPAAHAMTDVTGFGLAGHLLEMLDASGTAGQIDLPAVPLLSGAAELAALGHASTLAPANRAASAPRMTFGESPAAALLFDPQTCGGLLAAVPGGQANTLIAALHDADYPAAIIGRITEGPPHLTVTGSAGSDPST